MKVGIGAEDECSDLATFLTVEVESKGHHVTEFAADANSPGGAAQLAQTVGRAVASGQIKTALLIAHTGFSMAIAVNKVPGIRGALCTSMNAVTQSRTQNDANVLCLSADQCGPKQLSTLVNAWLSSW